MNQSTPLNRCAGCERAEERPPGFKYNSDETSWVPVKD
jgi:hypothetical protein